MELAEDFIKMLTIAVAIVGILAIFFVFIQYNIIISYNDAHREAVTLGDVLLASGCLAEVDSNGYTIKGLFLESKLNDIKVDPMCIDYDKGKFSVNLLEESSSWEDIKISDRVLAGGQTSYTVAVKMDVTDNTIKLATLEVEV